MGSGLRYAYERLSREHVGLVQVQTREWRELSLRTDGLIMSILAGYHRFLQILSGYYLIPESGSFADTAQSDQPGTLESGVTRRGGGGINLNAVVSDPDGITAIVSSFLSSSDGQTVQNLQWVRRDANSFTHVDNRNNNRWRRASLAVTYTDGNGVQRFLAANWDV